MSIPPKRRLLPIKHRSTSSCSNINAPISLSKTRLTKSSPNLMREQVFYYGGEPLEVKEQLRHSVNSSVYKVDTPPKDRKNVENPQAILKICSNNGTWQSRRDFTAEEDVLLKIEPHENIVQCYGIVTDRPGCSANAKIGFLMEYCPDGNLQDFLKNTILDQNKTFNIIKELIKPVVHLHKLNILHRDIKSLNYLVTLDKIKLCDFGLSREDSAYNRETTFKRARTTPIWSAPELYGNLDLDKGSDYTFKSDVYSLSVVLWEVLNTYINKAYSIPFTGNVYKIMNDIITGKRPNITNFPKEWRKILKKAWAKNMNKRPSINELQNSTNKVFEKND